MNKEISALRGWEKRLARQMLDRRFGKLVVKSRAADTSNGRSRWTCLCDCGKEKISRGSDLRRGSTKSCGCLIGVSNLKDLTGKTFGKLTVIERDPLKTQRPRWRCKCKCGANRTVAGHFLVSGGVRSCGCLLRRQGKDHPGWKGGRQIIDGYVVLKIYENGKRRIVKEHRLIMERILGRRLLRSETVHHKNGIRSENTPGNLELWTKAHPAGQRVVDVVEFALRILAFYSPKSLA
jgi:hypothetical protein